MLVKLKLVNNKKDVVINVKALAYAVSHGDKTELVFTTGKSIDSHIMVEGNVVDEIYNALKEETKKEVKKSSHK